MPKRGESFDIEAHRIISTFKDLSKEGKIKLISLFIEELKKQHELNDKEILSSFILGYHIAEEKKKFIPAGIFENDYLSSLEAIVKYLKEDLKIKFSKISKLLNRSSKTIWQTYHNAAVKMPSPFGDVSRKIVIPVSAFSNREFSILESLVGFIKDLDFSNHEVALMLHLDDRTIWTIYDRVKKKRGLKN